MPRYSLTPRHPLSNSLEDVLPGNWMPRFSSTPRQSTSAGASLEDMNHLAQTSARAGQEINSFLLKVLSCDFQGVRWGFINWWWNTSCNTYPGWIWNLMKWTRTLGLLCTTMSAVDVAPENRQDNELCEIADLHFWDSPPKWVACAMQRWEVHGWTPPLTPAKIFHLEGPPPPVLD